MGGDSYRLCFHVYFARIFVHGGASDGADSTRVWNPKFGCYRNDYIRLRPCLW